ncbi:proline racemase [Fusarium albosuccineum]|uniref:trans-L-3-hydroxyproline dehydratase n=1 Tax=Fusarium albosuccineum TaxID=1237068 RepID=A0A8H4L3E7_9HYPO|nr:proline racemase [Fusarium albosuccineum]
MPPSPFWIDTEDWHTAGEPFRVVKKLPEGYLPKSSTVTQRRLDIIADPHHPLDELRQSLCHEPRGHADMYGGFITPPDDAGAAFGVLFWHKDGFSTACGHGTIVLGYWAVANGLVKVPESGNGTVDVVIDVPSGRVTARVTAVDGKPVSADFINVLSYQLAKALPVSIPSRGVEVSVDLTFGGAVYATLDADQLNLKVEPRNVDEFIKLGREIKVSLGTRAHYGIYDCYGVIFFNEEGDREENGTRIVRQRNVTVFADGQIDRSPCGSGTCARLAVLLAQGRLTAQKSKLQHRSIIASQFQADIMSEEKAPVEGFPACIPRVTGEARLCGRMSFFIDPADSIYPGFLLR